jgi:hypothetical protein
MSRTVNVSAYVNVDVDLDEIGNDDLISELRSRNLGGEVDLNSFEEDITEMFYAFKLGQLDRAMELAKKIACNHTGRIL